MRTAPNKLGECLKSILNSNYIHMSVGTENPHSLNREGNADVAFGLSLAGGILVTLGSIFAFGWSLANANNFYGFMGSAMERSYYFHGMGPGAFGGIFSTFATIGAISGVLVVLFAILMRVKPADRRTYGTLILVFSVLSFAGMGGFIVGAILGIVGGVLALTT